MKNKTRDAANPIITTPVHNSLEDTELFVLWAFTVVLFAIKANSHWEITLKNVKKTKL